MQNGKMNGKLVSAQKCKNTAVNQQSIAICLLSLHLLFLMKISLFLLPSSSFIPDD